MNSFRSVRQRVRSAGSVILDEKSGLPCGIGRAVDGNQYSERLLRLIERELRDLDDAFIG